MRFAMSWTRPDSGASSLLTFYAAMALVGLGGGIVSPFITQYLNTLGINDAVIGTLVVLGAMGAMLVSLPGGGLRTQPGRKRFS